MKPQIIHKSSKSVETVGTVILVYGALLTLAGVIVAASAPGYQVWPGLVVAGYGISSILIGVAVKGASVIVRASETYLYNEEDHQLGDKDTIEKANHIPTREELEAQEREASEERLNS